MKSTPELEAEMLRLHYAEHWPVGTIATQLSAHPDQVRRVLGLADRRSPSQIRARLVDPYRPFIDDTLARYPKLRATRLYDMVRERGYPGSIRTLRESRRLPAFPGVGAQRALVALPRIEGFRCVATRASVKDGAAYLDAAALAALGLAPGEEALVWSDDAH